MRSKVIKIAIFALLLVGVAFLSNRIVVGVWGPEETVSTTKSPEGTGTTEVMKTKIKDTLVTAYYYDDYAKGVIEYAAVRFFNVNTKECNYVFFPGDTKVELSDEAYQKISDKEHLKKILRMPVHFLLQSGKGFFVQKEGYALALADRMEAAVKSPAFSEQMGDVIAYRTMDYYRRRYQGKIDE